MRPQTSSRILIILLIVQASLGAFVFSPNQATAAGTTYYVDNTITDSNVASATPDCTNYNPATFLCSGGLASAFATVADINAGSFNPGDQILFRDGDTWREQLVVPSSGSAGNPITFGTYGSGSKPVITGANNITGFSAETSSSTATSTITKTWSTWDNSVVGENLVDSGNTSFITYSKDVTDVAAKFVMTSAGTGKQELAQQVTGDTWQAWGVPASATVTQVQLTGWKKKLVANMGLTVNNWSVAIINASGTPVHATASVKLNDLQALATTTTDGSYVSGSAGTARAVDASYQSSATIVRLQLTNTWTSSGTVNIDQRFDDIAIGITYATTTISTSTVWDATVTTQPNVVVVGANLPKAMAASKAALAVPGDWYWAANVLSVYAPSDPSGAVEAGNRGSGVVRTNDKSYVTVDGLTIRDGNQQGINVGSISVTGIALQNCVVESNAGDAIDLKGSGTAHDVTINNCTIQNNGNWGIDVGDQYTTSSQISNNTLTGNGWNSVANNQEYSEIDGALGNFNIFGNTIYAGTPAGCKNGGSLGDFCHGIYYSSGFGGDQTIPVNIYQNKTYNNGYGTGIKAVGSANIYENVVYGNDGSGISLGQNGAVNVVYQVYANLVYNNNISNAGGGIVEQTKGAGTINLTTNNNTLYQNASSSGLEVKITDDLTSALNILNNLMYTTPTRRTMSLATQTGAVNIDYNLHWRADGAPLMTYNGSGETFAQWQALGFDTHGVSLDPKFTNASSSIFTLTSSSPAIDAGLSLGSTYQLGLDPASTWPSNVLTLNQNSFGSGWDIGAYVYTQTSTPSISITAPLNGATVSNTITVTVTSSAVSPASISSVQFLLDGSPLGSAVTSSSYQISWNTASVANGSHILTASTTDNYGNSATSSAITVTVQNLAVLSVTTSTSFSFSAAHGSTATSSQSLVVKNTGIASTTLNWSASSTQTWLTFSPASSSLAGGASTSVAFIVNPATLALGTYNATATISDPSASSSPQRIPVIFSISSTGISTSITSPVNGATVSGATTVTATATSTVGISSVQFYLDGSPFGFAATSSPYGISWNTAAASNASHTLYALATDNNANTASSSVVTVTVDNLPPFVSITSPANGATVSGTNVAVVASSTDTQSGVASVQFYLDGSLLGQSSSSPFMTTWDTTLTTNGAHTLTAIATDGAGNATTSPATSLTVANTTTPPPTPVTVGVASSYAIPNYQGPGNTPPPSSSSSSSTPSSTADLQALLNSLTTQLQTLLTQAASEGIPIPSTGNIPFIFTRDLQLHDTGADVEMLQKFLNAKGFLISQTGPGSPGNETVYFGSLTWRALITFQKSVNINPAQGYFGPITRAWVNAAEK